MENKPDNKTNDTLAKFNELTATYRKLFNLCYDALAPGKSQTERNELRQTLKEIIRKD